MNKTMEYMAFGLPTVAFDLKETRVSAGDAALYATPNKVEDFAHVLVRLLDDEPLRQLMGKVARSRVESELAWQHQRASYLEVYERLLGAAPQALEVNTRLPEPSGD